MIERLRFAGGPVAVAWTGDGGWWFVAGVRWAGETA
jgi:hypothetical protein